MSANLSPVFGAGWQLFTNQGVVLSGGLIFTYLAGSTTPQATWTDATQTVPNANPIVLPSSGRPLTEIWLAAGVAYKFVLEDSTGFILGTWDNIVGITPSVVSQATFVQSGLTPTFINGTSFSVPGNQVAIFDPNRRIQYVLAGGTFYGTVTTSVFGVGITTVTIVPDNTPLDNTLSSVAYSVFDSTNTAIPGNYLHDLTAEGPFVSGVDFTPGTTTTLALSRTYPAPVNLTVHYDGVYQGFDTYTVGTLSVTFSNPIPVGVNKVYIVGMLGA